MTKIVCITSMNKTYHDELGNRLISSYNEHIKDIPLYVYNEDWKLDDSNPNIIPMGWDLGSDYEEFGERWDKKSDNRIRIFSKKAYSIIHACENIDADRIIWFDADCVIKQPLDEQILETIAPDNKVSSHFGVYHTKNDTKFYSCETGFFVLNLRHPNFLDFLNFYKSVYNTDNYTNLRRFYDGEVYGASVLEMEKFGDICLDLSPRGRKEFKTPMSRSILQDYFSHFKGKKLKNKLKN